MDIGSILLILSIATLVGLLVAKPFYMDSQPTFVEKPPLDDLERVEEELSDLVLEKDRLLSVLQELDIDHSQQKIPDEAYLIHRKQYKNAAAGVLLRIDELDAQIQSMAVTNDKPAMPSPPESARDEKMDQIEELIAARRRSRNEKSAGFCPHCGKVIQSSDQYCPACGSKVAA